MSTNSCSSLKASQVPVELELELARRLLLERRRPLSREVKPSWSYNRLYSLAPANINLRGKDAKALKLSLTCQPHSQMDNVIGKKPLDPSESVHANPANCLKAMTCNSQKSVVADMSKGSVNMDLVRKCAGQCKCN